MYVFVYLRESLEDLTFVNCFFLCKGLLSCEDMVITGSMFFIVSFYSFFTLQASSSHETGFLSDGSGHH